MAPVDSRDYAINEIYYFGDLSFAVQFNAGTPWHFAQLGYPRVG